MKTFDLADKLDDFKLESRILKRLSQLPKEERGNVSFGVYAKQAGNQGMIV